MAMGKVLASTSKMLALTGTFIGGYANHLFPLMMRMAPDDMKARGFEWGEDFEFSQQFGRIDRIITSKCAAEVVTTRGQKSMRKQRIGNSQERKSVRPGIMPTLFGQIVQPIAMFLSLDELAEELPPLEEFIAQGACDLPVDIHAEYLRVERKLVERAREMMAKGSIKLLGTMLHTLLAYPDHPYGWEPHFEGEQTVGFWEIPKLFTQENWKGVVSPWNFDLEQRILPKERKLIDLCKTHAAQKNQVWVFCQQTQKRNVMPRLKKLLEAEGLRAGILRAGDVDMRERAAWITEKGLDYDVMLSHPQLVGTGLDLFSKKGGHNYNVLVFFETGYNLFTMRQASRRAWRIGQPKDCEIHYLHYRSTMEQRAMLLMAKKAEAATSLEGDVSVEGLAALAGDDNAQMAMVRALAEKIDDNDIQRKWGRVKFGTRKPPKPEPTEEEKAAAASRAEAEERRHREMEEMLEGMLKEEPEAAVVPGSPPEPEEPPDVVPFPSLATGSCYVPTEDQAAGDEVASIISLAKHTMHDHGLAPTPSEDDELIAMILAEMDKPRPKPEPDKVKPMPKGVKEVKSKGKLSDNDYRAIFADLGVDDLDLGLHTREKSDEMDW